MNKLKCDILQNILKNGFENQRILTDKVGCSIGAVNKYLNELIEELYIDENMQLTEKAYTILKKSTPKNAIILAAGYGMRMVPINTSFPKGLIEVKGEPLIERTIKQLKESGVNKIYIVVGFMKEQYEYLIDKYDVELIVNSVYKEKNNLHSVRTVLDLIGNSYIIPCDIWLQDNPYSRSELYSWYMISDDHSDESTVRINRKNELVKVKDNGNSMVGIAYITNQDGSRIKRKIKRMCEDKYFDNAFWEEAAYDDTGKMIFWAKIVPSINYTEINTYEQLREFDGSSNQLETEAIDVICEALNVSNEDIKEITVLKKGMTNRSFLFRCKEKKYIMRIPGEGTDKLIDRTAEADVYKTIKGRNICDEVVYIDSKTGYKITEFMENARVCDPDNLNDLKICMNKLREFHSLNLEVDHEFNVFKQIDFYESLWDGKLSIYRDYLQTKENVISLKPYIEKNTLRKVLTHIDAVPDNFLFTDKGIRLIDWEYAGMQDPHVDIAMFCIYSMYNKLQIDTLIDVYFENQCSEKERCKIYCYISVCGLLWSNWCEYKRQLGVEFGEYSLKQYRYAKDFYKIASTEIKKMEGYNE